MSKLIRENQLDKFYKKEDISVRSYKKRKIVKFKEHNELKKK
ncbi:MAG: hypothetical protein RRZ84_07810 [Romboutsia sp.]